MLEPFVVDGVWIPKAVVTIRSRYAVPLFLEIRRHCYETPECFPGVRRLARLVGCAIGTVSALTDQFHALGIIKKLHDGRRCLYRFAEGCWRRRKARKSAHCSAKRKEDRSNFVESTDKRESHKNNRVSLPVASNETRNKRVSLLVSLRRWCEMSPELPDSEREHRLSVLDRAGGMLDNWSGRSPDDKRCLEMLITRARAMPLDGALTDSLRQAPVGMRAIGAFLPSTRLFLDAGR
jgi:hypothetical protein